MRAKFGGEFPKIGAPALRALDAAGISQLSDLTRFSEQQLLSLHGFGPRALRLLRQRLAEQGKTFFTHSNTTD